MTYPNAIQQLEIDLVHLYTNHHSTYIVFMFGPFLSVCAALHIPKSCRSRDQRPSPDKMIRILFLPANESFNFNYIP